MDQLLLKILKEKSDHIRQELEAEELSIKEEIKYAKENHGSLGQNYWVKLETLRTKHKFLEKLMKELKNAISVP